MFDVYFGYLVGICWEIWLAILMDFIYLSHHLFILCLRDCNLVSLTGGVYCPIGFDVKILLFF